MDYSACRYLDVFTIYDLSYLLIGHLPPTPGMRDPKDPQDAIHRQADLLAEQMIADATAKPAKLDATRRDIGDNWELSGGGEWIVTREAAVTYCEKRDWRPPFLFAVTAEKSLSTHERNQILEILLGMAIAKYGYDPNAARNQATGGNRGSIAADMQTVGLSAEPDTIRKYLAEAANMFPDAIAGKS